MWSYIESQSQSNRMNSPLEKKSFWTNLWKYSRQDSETPSWKMPMLWITWRFTSSEQRISYLDRKWSATAISASFGQRWNQSMVQPEMSPGNLSALVRNLSPTCWGRKWQNMQVTKRHLVNVDNCSERGMRLLFLIFKCWLFYFLILIF